MRFLLRWTIAVAGLSLLFLTGHFNQLRAEASTAWQFFFWGNEDVFQADIIGHQFHKFEFSEPVDYELPKWSTDEELLIYGASDGTIHAVRNGQGTSAQVTFPAEHEIDYAPRWSPTKDEFIFIREGSESNRYSRQIYLKTTDGIQILPNKDFHPDGYILQWSPDGTKILFGAYSSVTGDDSLFVYDLKTMEATDIVEDNAINYPTYPSWSPDSEWISFLAEDDENESLYRIFKVHPNGQDLQAISPINYDIDYYETQWSPRGDYIAVLGESYENYIGMQFSFFSPDGQYQKIFELNELYIYEEDWLWTPDGRWIVFTDDWGYLFRLEVATGELTKIIEDDEEYFLYPKLSKPLDQSWRSIHLFGLASLLIGIGILLSLKKYNYFT